MRQSCLRYRRRPGQELHFKQVFKAGQMVGFTNKETTKLSGSNDVRNGSLGDNHSRWEDQTGKEVKTTEKIKTRAGKSVKLQELIDEAKERALK